MTSCEKLARISYNKKGFTLMEVMIAMAILAIALIATYQSQSQSLSMASRSRFLTTSSLLAQSKMAELDATELDRVSPGSGDFGEDFPDYSWRVEVTDTSVDLIKKIAVSVTNDKMVSNNIYQLDLYKITTR